MALGNAMGGPEKARAMSKGQGVSLILKSLSIKFKRPVTYPDTVSTSVIHWFFPNWLICSQLLIAHKPYFPTSVSQLRFHFNCRATIYSYSQQAIVVESDSELVWYDYDKLKKCNPGPEAWGAVMGQVGQNGP